MYEDEANEKFSEPDFIEKTVKLKLGAEVDESLVAECLEWTVRDHGAHLVQILDEYLQLGILEAKRTLLGLLALEDLEHSLVNCQAVAKIRGKLALPMVSSCLRSMNLCSNINKILILDSLNTNQPDDPKETFPRQLF